MKAVTVVGTIPSQEVLYFHKRKKLDNGEIRNCFEQLSELEAENLNPDNVVWIEKVDTKNKILGYIPRKILLTVPLEYGGQKIFLDQGEELSSAQHYNLYFLAKKEVLEILLH